MDPNRNETTAALIARRPERLNILVTKLGTAPIRGAQTCNGVVVRYGWTALTESENLDGINRPVGISVPVLGSRYDPTETNRLGQPGAVVSTPDVDGIRRAVATLREAWGPLHVQDNSGLVPDLHQGMWQG